MASGSCSTFLVTISPTSTGSSSVSASIDVGIVLERSRRVLGREVHGDRAVTAFVQLWDEALPAPGSVPGAVDQNEGRHGVTLVAEFCRSARRILERLPRLARRWRAPVAIVRRRPTKAKAPWQDADQALRRSAVAARHEHKSSQPSRRLLPRTAMKEGLLGDRLGVSSRSEHEEARSYVARWVGSESSSA